MPDDYAASIHTTGSVAVGGSAEGNIETGDDFDWFAVEFEAGRTYVIDLEGTDTGGGTLANPILRGLYDDTGSRIPGTRTNSGGEGNNARLEFTADESGTYYIAARGRGDTTGTYTVRVTDPDAADASEAPVFGEQDYAFSLAENSDGSTERVALGTVSATDPEGATVSYSITGGNESALFEIDASTGALYYTGSGEDYETGPTSHALTVRASDGDLHADVTVTVTVTDVQEGVVSVSEAQRSVSEADGEDLPADDTTTGRVAVGGTATGNIAFGDDWDWFAVELELGRTYVIDLEGADTGGGTLANPILRGLYDDTGNRIPGTRTNSGGEGNNARLEFTADESGTYYIAARGRGDTTGTYTVRVTDPDAADTAAAPVFGEQGYAFTLSENADGSTERVALGTVSATDPEGATVSYSITGGNESALFEIDASTGALYYTGSGEDYETGPTSHVLTVRASDGDLHADTSVTVTVTDASEAPSFAEAGYAFSLAENTDGSTARVALGAVAATDPDGATVSYSIAGGNEAGLFEIDAATGALYYTGSGEDYEAGPASYALTVRASDGSLHADTSVTVTVTDASEAPSFTEAGYAFSLAENADGSADRVALGTVSATDPEGAAVSYSIAAGNEAGLFEIDASTGALFYTGTGEDYEAGPASYALTVRASDGDLHADVTVTVTVTDVPEQASDPLQSVSEPDGQDLPTNATTTGVVAVGDSVTGNIETGDDGTGSRWPSRPAGPTSSTSRASPPVAARWRTRCCAAFTTPTAAPLRAPTATVAVRAATLG